MEASRHTSPLILAAIVAGSALLLQEGGFFEGAFRTDILASVSAEESLGAADFQALNSLASTQEVDPRKTAVVH
ncbi:hypothetical protein EV128_115133 [Rhizobium azibense]|nr:hypothetical protein EV128_115133 [Rhizobium azibense]